MIKTTYAETNYLLHYIRSVFRSS